jgi:hypothetical protein
MSTVKKLGKVTFQIKLKYCHYLYTSERNEYDRWVKEKEKEQEMMMCNVQPRPFKCQPNLHVLFPVY